MLRVCTWLNLEHKDRGSGWDHGDGWGREIEQKGEIGRGSGAQLGSLGMNTDETVSLVLLRRLMVTDKGPHASLGRGFQKPLKIIGKDFKRKLLTKQPEARQTRGHITH